MTSVSVSSTDMVDVAMQAGSILLFKLFMMGSFHPNEAKVSINVCSDYSCSGDIPVYKVEEEGSATQVVNAFYISCFSLQEANRKVGTSSWT